MAYRQSDISKDQIHNDSVFTVAWSKNSPDNNYILTGSVNSEIKVWSKTSTELSLVHTLNGHRLGVNSIDIFSDPENKTPTMAVSTSMDSCIRFWNVEKGVCEKVIEAPPIEAWTICFSPDGRHVATGSQTGNVNIYGVESGVKEMSLDAQKKSFCMSVAYSGNGRFVACGLQDGSVTIFDVSTGSVYHHLDAHSLTVRSLSFSLDSSLLISSSDDKSIHVYDVKSGALSRVLSGHESSVFCVRVSPNGKHFASCSADRSVRIWELSTLECIHVFEGAHADIVWSLAYNHDGSCLASVSSDLSLKLYNCPLDDSK